MSQPAPRTGQCPNCGASIDFKIGASRATVCSYCQAVVARKGQDFEAIGKVADLIPTGSRIALNSKGRLDKVAFEVVGRLQYEWKSGVWDEWYVAFSDGRWGWLAEAQGRFYLTFKVPPRPLPQRVPEPGESLFLEGLGRFTVSDVKQAQIVGMAGELPDAVTVGESPLTADLESEKAASPRSIWAPTAATPRSTWAGRSRSTRSTSVAWRAWAGSSRRGPPARSSSAPIAEHRSPCASRTRRCAWSARAATTCSTPPRARCR